MLFKGEELLAWTWCSSSTLHPHRSLRQLHPCVHNPEHHMLHQLSTYWPIYSQIVLQIQRTKLARQHNRGQGINLSNKLPGTSNNDTSAEFYVLVKPHIRGPHVAAIGPGGRDYFEVSQVVGQRCGRRRRRCKQWPLAAGIMTHDLHETEKAMSRIWG
jgi:hypothetical protein